ncbi:MAG: YraN family protein [Candidatus Eisenbacteria bacterium]|nr:YraN family protein [Candidatus Eisenbacteria bacterium]
MNRRKRGTLAEEIAARFLQLKGYSILATGYRFRSKELDIVARRGDVVVFVEVKMRAGDRRGTPRESVDARKRRHVVFAARGFLRERGLADGRSRFDVIEVNMRRGGLVLRVEHLPDAFRADRA